MNREEVLARISAAESATAAEAAAKADSAAAEQAAAAAADAAAAAGLEAHQRGIDAAAAISLAVDGLAEYLTGLR